MSRATGGLSANVTGRTERQRLRGSGGEYAEGVRALILDPSSIAGLDELLERRRRWGVDIHDEVWEGVLHVASAAATSGTHGYVAQQLAVLLGPLARAAALTPTSAFNLGEWEHDYRVPDGGLHRTRSWDDMCAATAALVIEIITPNDESWEKLPFYAAHQVDELLIVDPAQRTVDWFALEQGEYRTVERRRLIDLGPAELVEQIDWP